MEFAIYSIGIGACVFAILSVAVRDIFHSAVWLSLTLLCVSGLYFSLNAPFLGVIQVLVYIGGIITLFIFAIKLTARIGDKTIAQTNNQVLISLLASVVFFVFLLSAILRHPWGRLATVKELPLKELGQSLLTNYMLPFEFLSLILLAVMVGAIVIGKVKK